MRGKEARLSATLTLVCSSGILSQLLLSSRWWGGAGAPGVGVPSGGSLSGVTGSRSNLAYPPRESLHTSRTQFPHLLIYVINNVLLSTYYVPGTVAGPGDITVSEIENSYYLRTYILVGVKQCR